MKQYGLWIVTPHAKLPIRIFKNADTGKTARRHEIKDGWTPAVAYEFVAYLNSRVNKPLYQIGGASHSRRANKFLY